MIRPTPCRCETAGVCPNHLQFIGPRGVLLCQSSQKHYDAFHVGIEERQQKFVALPSLIEQAKTLASAVAKLAQKGFVRADEPTQDYRQSICRTCPGNENGRCRGCGCLLSLKVQFPAEKCPLGFWGAVPDHPEVSTTEGGCGCSGTPSPVE